jgi:acetate kinase
VNTKFTYSFQSKDFVNKSRAAGFQKDLAKHPEMKDCLALPK